jgi:hypothetical protein
MNLAVCNSIKFWAYTVMVAVRVTVDVALDAPAKLELLVVETMAAVGVIDVEIVDGFFAGIALNGTVTLCRASRPLWWRIQSKTCREGRTAFRDEWSERRDLL